MTALFTGISTFFVSIFAQFAVIFGRKFTVGTASVLAFIATTIAALACLNSLVQLMLNLIVMPSWLATGLAFFIPSNYLTVFSLVLSGKICKRAYGLAMTKIDLLTKAN